MLCIQRVELALAIGSVLDHAQVANSSRIYIQVPAFPDYNVPGATFSRYVRASYWITRGPSEHVRNGFCRCAAREYPCPIHLFAMSVDSSELIANVAQVRVCILNNGSTMQHISIKINFPFSWERAEDKDAKHVLVAV